MGFKKNLKTLKSLPVEMRLAAVVPVLEGFGYTLKRVQGSHFHFSNDHGYIFTIPVHNKVIKRRYLKKIVHDIIQPHHE